MTDDPAASPTGAGASGEPLERADGLVDDAGAGDPLELAGAQPAR